MTLPHNPAITVIDLPEDMPEAESFAKHIAPHLLPQPGTWKLICLGNQATEEEAREIVESDGDGMYRDYKYTTFDYYSKTATASLRSLITANGWKNPVFLRKEK